jgi:thioredoxin-dependent peroxiredoxin
MITEGTKAPDFALADADGKTWSLADFAGKKLVLYFYPKDDTPGCTKEACGFRDQYSVFAEKGMAVVGVSPDSAASHARFRGKYSLPFVLLSDPEKKVLTSYGAFGEKTLYGKKVMGVIRSTFLIDEMGKVVKVYPKVSPEGHAEQILAAF